MPPSGRGRVRLGGRDVTVELIASSLADKTGGPDRPVLDQTGLSGTFDFTLEWTLQPRSGEPVQLDLSGPLLPEALKEQLGLKLDSQTGAVDVWVIDHVEQPSEN
jgi:uncharacterized protein (TIGR03435 family)